VGADFQSILIGVVPFDAFLTDPRLGAFDGFVLDLFFTSV
jgi:hypothetical protein